MKTADKIRWLAFAALWACAMLLPSGWVWTVPVAAALAELGVTAWDTPDVVNRSIIASYAAFGLIAALCVVELELCMAPVWAGLVAFVGAGVLPLNTDPPRRA